MRLKNDTRLLLFASVSVLLGLTACDTAGAPSDAEPVSDAAGPDAGTRGGTDAGEADAGPTDAGPLPTGLFAMEDLEYAGAFRLSSADFGDSNTNYAVGTLGHNPDRNSLFIAGHAQHNAIAEFAIPETLGTGTVVADLPVVEAPLQEFHNVLGDSANGNPDSMDRVTGLYWSDGHLIVQTNRWYDAAASATDTTLLVVDGELDGTVIGYFELAGRARAAGFVSPIPEAWQAALGGPALAGWASNYSIIGRYSVGPTLFAFDPADLTAEAGNPAAEGSIETTAHLDYAYSEGVYLAEDALEQQCSIEDDVTSCEEGAAASSLWNFLSKAMYGFIVPGTRTYAVFGSSGGMTTGIGYKIRQDNDNLCGGYCAYGADDYANYYWLYDLDDVLDGETLSAPQPYAYGVWDVPFDDGGAHRIIGGTWDAGSSTLYLSLANAGQVGDYDRPPVIVAYRIEL
ncbi:MAG: hypothetical protein AB8I08_03305 [Sandaracinaceae bacterium]